MHCKYSPIQDVSLHVHVSALCILILCSSKNVQLVRTTSVYPYMLWYKVWPGAVSTHGRDIVQDDMYTRKCFSESEGTRFSGPGQKALLSMNEFTLFDCFVDCCLIPLSNTCSFDVAAMDL